MVEAKLYSFEDTEVEPHTVKLDERIFAVPVNTDILYRTVRMQLMNRRQGTHSTKTRGEAHGGGRKPWRQKGTGRARAGSRRSPVWVGGGTTFGPKPRAYTIKLPKKMKKAALLAALSDRAGEEKVVLLDRAGFTEPKTKQAIVLLNRLGMTSSALVVVGKSEYNTSVRKSFSNLPQVKCLGTPGLNVYDILRHDGLVLTLGALAELKARF